MVDKESKESECSLENSIIASAKCLLINNRLDFIWARVSRDLSLYDFLSEKEKVQLEVDSFDSFNTVKTLKYSSKARNVLKEVHQSYKTMRKWIFRTFSEKERFSSFFKENYSKYYWKIARESLELVPKENKSLFLSTLTELKKETTEEKNKRGPKLNTKILQEKALAFLLVFFFGISFETSKSSLMQTPSCIKTLTKTAFVLKENKGRFFIALRVPKPNRSFLLNKQFEKGSAKKFKKKVLDFDKGIQKEDVYKVLQKSQRIRKLRLSEVALWPCKLHKYSLLKDFRFVKIRVSEHVFKEVGAFLAGFSKEEPVFQKVSYTELDRYRKRVFSFLSKSLFSTTQITRGFLTAAEFLLCLWRDEPINFAFLEVNFLKCCLRLAKPSWKNVFLRSEVERLVEIQKNGNINELIGFYLCLLKKMFFKSKLVTTFGKADPLIVLGWFKMNRISVIKYLDKTLIHKLKPVYGDLLN